MADQMILREDFGAVRRLTLNHPPSLNALSEAMLGAMEAEIADLAQSPAIKTVVLAGAGRAFCAGHDLKEMSRARAAEDGGAAYFVALFKRCGAMMLSLNALPQIIIAQAHGIATAAGCQLVASCDLALAAKSTRFGVNGVNIGLFCSTPMVALTRAIGPKAAMEMLVTGRFITAERAQALGLINEAVEEEALGEAALEMAQEIAGKLGAALRIGKRAFYEQAFMARSDAYDYAAEVMAANMMEGDTSEGIAAFLEKRVPKYKGS